MKAGLITGASSGIGKELARIHASNGNNVILVARRTEQLQELANEIEGKYNVKTWVISADLGKIDEVHSLISNSYIINVAVYKRILFFQVVLDNFVDVVFLTHL